MVGLRIPEAMKVRSFLAMLKGNPALKDWRRNRIYTYWSGPSNYGLQTPRYTCVHILGFTPELYERNKDADQMDNITGKPEISRIIEKLGF